MNALLELQKELYKLVDRLNGLIDNKQDRLLVIQLYPGCHAVIGRYGNTLTYEPEQTLII